MNDISNLPDNSQQDFNQNLSQDLNCWQVLAIEPSPDETTIKRAYAVQLKFNRPDRNPQGFQRLRAAYEEALSIRYWVGNDWEDEYEDENFNDTHTVLNDTTAVITTVPTNLVNDNDNDSDSDTSPSIPIIPIHYKYAELTLSSSDSFIETPTTEILADDNQALDYTLLDNQPLDTQVLENHIEIFSLDNELAATPEDELPAWEEQWQHATQQDTVQDKQHLSESLSESQDNSRSETEDIFTENEPSVTAYDLQIDQRLFTLLSQQLATLSWSSLDDKADFEERLIGWWSEQSHIFPKSYSLAEQFFDWQQRLNSWQYNHYPWYMLTPIQERHLQWQTIARQEQWQHATNPNTAPHHFNQQTIALDLADQNLYELLSQQIQEIESLPAELKVSYHQAFEMDLLKWWQKKSDRYPNSYEMAYQYFDWHQDPEAQNQVKTHLLKSLKRRYQHLMQLQQPGGFHNLLASDYYHISRLWMPNLHGESQLVNRWDFFKTYFIPANALLLANDFERLDSHWQSFMDNHQLPSDTLNKIEAYRHNPDLTTLQRWLYHGFFDWKTLLVINIGVAAVVVTFTYIRGNGHSVTVEDYVFDIFGLIAVVTAGLYYWQLLLRFFAQPSQFRFNFQHIIIPFIILSMLFLGNYLAWESVSAAQMLNNTHTSKTFTPPPVHMSYYFAHLFGLLILLLFNNEQTHIGLKIYGWLWGIILMMCTLVFPLLGLAFASSSMHTMNYTALSPLWWLVISVPFMLMIFIERFEKMAFANRIVNWFIYFSVFISLLLLLFIYTYAVTELPYYKLGFTGVGIVIIGFWMMAISFRSLKRLGEIAEN